MASLSHTILSLGESTSSSLAGCLPPSRSCHVGRPAGVLATAAAGSLFSPFCEVEAAALFLFGSVGSASAASLGAFGGGGSNWKAWSLFRAESDTGPRAGGGFAVGLLFVLFHCARFKLSAFSFFELAGEGCSTHRVVRLVSGVVRVGLLERGHVLPIARGGSTTPPRSSVCPVQNYRLEIDCWGEGSAWKEHW